jgi:hypothetical protein
LSPASIRSIMMLAASADHHARLKSSKESFLQAPIRLWVLLEPRRLSRERESVSDP